MKNKINIILIVSLCICLVIIGALLYYRQASPVAYLEAKSSESKQQLTKPLTPSFTRYSDPTDQWTISVPEQWEIETKEEDPRGEKESPNFSTTKLEFGEGDDKLTSIGITISSFGLVSDQDAENLAFSTNELTRTTFNDFPAYTDSRDVSTNKLYSEIHSLYVVIPEESTYYEISGYVTTERLEHFTRFSEQIKDVIYSFSPPQVQ